MKYRGLLSAVALCASLGAAYWYSPRYSLKQLQTSLATSDVTGLERYIDWPSVREGLRTDLTADFLEKTSARNDKKLTSPFITLLGPAMVTYLVDTFISPQALIKRVETSDPNSLTVVSADFTALDEFTIAFSNPSDQQTIRAVMKRDGFRWRITRVLLPTNLLEDVAAKNVAGSPILSNETSSIDDAPASGSVDLGRGNIAPDASLKAAAQAGAARLDMIDDEARMRAQAEAIAARRAQIDAATAQMRALSDENAILRQQAQEAEFARARAEEDAYNAQQRGTVVIVQPRYADRDTIVHGRNNDRKPSALFNRPTTPNIERKNIETRNNTPQTHTVSTVPSVTPRDIGLQHQSIPQPTATLGENISTR